MVQPSILLSQLERYMFIDRDILKVQVGILLEFGVKIGGLILTKKLTGL
jgi:hypothetical protein